ncbi:MAG: acyltransferase [Micromonosporaceae bacterium]|nr:acyltransferase [Micromonosporaceae bacterium]
MTAVCINQDACPACPVPGQSAPTGKISRHRKFRPDIEGLRAIAVLLVVIGHSGLALSGGFVGVDVFFVISGFLITRQLHDELRSRGRISFGRFYARRARRILPAAAVVIVATVVASRIWISPLRLPAVAKDAVFSALSGVNWRLAAEGMDYFQATAPPSPFQHYWSLGVEEQFYAIWPVLLVIGAFGLRRWAGQRTAIVGVLCAVVAGSLLCSLTMTGTSGPWAYYGLHTRAWELAAGSLIAVGAPAIARLSQALAAALSWLGIGLIAAAALRFDAATAYPGYAVILPVAGACAIIAAGCSAPAFGSELLLRRAPMQLIGRLSYSWYLWHWPALIIMKAALERELCVAEICAALGGSLLASLATFTLIERPLRARRGLIEHPQRGLGLGGAIVAASVITALVISSTAVSAVPAGRPDPAGQAAQQVTGAASDPNAAVDPAVVEATRIRRLPPVTPELGLAKDDGPATKACLLAYTDSVPKNLEDCLFGDQRGHRTAVLFGDSHAAQWTGALASWAAKHRWRLALFAKAACSPGDYPGLVSLRLHRTYRECAEWRATVVEQLERLRPDLIIVSGNWTVLATSQRGIEKTVKRLSGTGGKIAFIADTPLMTSNIPECLAEHPDDIQRCTTTTADAGITAPGRIAEIDGARAGQAAIIDLTPWLCSDTACPAIISQTVVYRDESHLTNTFAMRLLPVLEPALDLIVQ